MDTFVVECRNQDAIDLTQGNTNVGINNGEWVTNLNGNNIMLENGDSIICRNSYIDTKSQAENKIIIPEDIKAEIDFVNYQKNWNGNEKIFDNSRWETAPASEKIPLEDVNNVSIAQTDGKLHVQCESIPTGTNFRALNYLQYQGVEDLQDVGGFDVVFVYNDQNGIEQKKTISLPKYLEWLPGVPSKVYVGIIFRNTAPFPAGMTTPCEGFVANKDGTPNFSQKITGTDNTNTFFQDTQMEDVQFASKALGSNSYAPKVNSIPFTIPAGNYDPQELTEFINETVTKNKGTPSLQNLSNNPLLIGVGGVENLNPSLNHFVPFLDSSDDVSQYGYSINTTNGVKARICGASQFVLTYKEDTNRFSFQFLHPPIYSDAQGNNGSDMERVGYGTAIGFTPATTNPPTPAFPQNTFAIDKDGGICFTKLSPPSFWGDILGFDINPFKLKNGLPTNIPNPNSIVTNFTMESQKGTVNYEICKTSATVPIFLTKPKEGVSLTGGFMGVASSFEKGSGFQNPIVLGTPNINGTTVDKMVAIGNLVQDIDADKTQFVGTGTTAFGYFLIEVKAQFCNNFLAPKGNFKSIVAIVSRYYEKASYTSSSSADSIVYTHYGEPQLLSSFTCRILNPQKQLATNIGSDNTVILEIVKASQQPKALKGSK